MSDGLAIAFPRHSAAFARMAATSKKDLVTLWKEEARICFGGSAKMPGVAGVTPPYGAGTLQNTGKAAAQARSKIAADIRALYGLPRDAMDLIKAKAPANTAKAFWKHHKQGETQAANDILRATTGSILYPFDGGVHHRRNFRKRPKNFRFFVSDPDSLEEYIELHQSRVWWLASGWQEPLEALRARLPAGVTKHGASPGRLKVDTQGGSIEIAAVNQVKYGPRIKDMSRRLRIVMNEWRVERLDRMWTEYLKRLASGNLKLTTR
ncbi:MAG: hypothetical protein KCHDKBKB_03000 [Elusimicrobia bacterium]|nr:hypothetical protein [Elusimicrobiota bacterium]